MKIGYGYQAEPREEDPFVHMAGDAMEKFARAGVPGAFMVDMLPFRASTLTVPPLPLTIPLFPSHATY